ncbi:MAG: hypothetical protein IKJ28_01460, partial [Alphaproteobacteria bacterium]|nr:hypothetical protein [Alphaproteobacteria bacterium]
GGMEYIESTNKCYDSDGGYTENYCDAGEIWNGSACVPNSCTTTEDCPGTYYCDITDGQCIKDWECENPHALDVIKEECSECANRTWSEAGKCAACPSNQVRLETGLCGCTNICPQNQSQNPETCACYCDETKYEEMPDTTGMCTCKTEDVMAIDLVSDAQNSGGMDCKITVADLGYLNGTYYFEWVDGFHYYECESKSVGFSVFLFAESTNLGYILNVDKPESHYVCYYQDPVSLENALKNNPIKYFSFDGSQKITLQFWDDHCYDNCGSMNFKLHKVIDYCITNSCSNTNMCTEGSICDLTDGICINNWNCGDPHTLDISRDDCLMCENRVWTENNKCMICPNDQIRLETGICGCPLEKPYIADNVCVSECPTDKSLVHNGVCVNECPEGYKEQEGECVVDVARACQTAMTTAGFNISNFTMDNTTITYTGNMTVASDLDISNCDLVVAGTLTISNNMTLKVNNVTATASSGNGININTNATIIAIDVNSSGMGIGAEGINNKGVLNATDITASGTPAGAGISNTGTMTIENEIFGTGGVGGITNSGNLTAKQVKGIIADLTGYSDLGGVINSGTIKAITVIGKSDRSIDVPGGPTKLGIVNNSLGLIEATTVSYCLEITNSGKIIGNISCNCEDTTQCSGTAPTQCTSPTPVLSGNLTTCVSCETADSTKPYFDGTSCVASCPTERPYLDNGVCVTSCPAERSEIGTNNTCIATEQWCVNQMEISGFTGDDYTVSGNTITYAGDMTVAQDLNISKCDLTVNGTLIVNEGVVLNGHDMNAIGVTGNGITLYGMMNVNNITATSTADATYGVRVMSAGNLTATDITASGKKYGFYSKGIVSATNITGSGEARGVYLKSTVPLVIKEEIVGISETSAGVSIAGPETVVTAKNVVGTSTSGYGIAIDGKLIVTGTAKGTSVSSVGIRIYYGTVTSDSVTTVYEGTLIATGDVTGISTDNNGINCGYKLETEGNIFAKSESSYALTVLGTVKAKDIYYCKKYYIYDEASIVGTLKCNSGCTCTN